MRIGNLPSPVKPDAFLHKADDSLSKSVDVSIEKNKELNQKMSDREHSHSFSSASTASTICPARTESEDISAPLDSAAVPKRTAPKRRQRKQQEEKYLHDFLREFKFHRGVNKPRSRSFFDFQEEQLYPIHVAAILGDYPLLRFLVLAGAHPDQATSKGQKAIDFAIERNHLGSHRMAIEFLKSGARIVTMRQFRGMVG